MLGALVSEHFLIQLTTRICDSDFIARLGDLKADEVSFGAFPALRDFICHRQISSNLWLDFTAPRAERAP